MGQRRDIGRGIGAIGAIVGINLVIGVIGYFIAFLFAYGFSDQIDRAQHVFFLIVIGILASWRPSERPYRRLPSARASP